MKIPLDVPGISAKPIAIDDYNVFTYRRIRRAIGVLGISLPFALVILSLIDYFGTPIQPSISDYYYTNLREIFTGTLCAVGLFLLRYKGHGNPVFWKNDNILTNIAGLMAIGVALVPTNPGEGSEKLLTVIPSDASWLGWLHYGFAGMLFLTFSLLSINVFTLGQKDEDGKPKSVLNENHIYKFCGYSILVFIALVPLSAKLGIFPYSTLVLEALCLFFFGTAWLIKGRALGDKGKLGETLYSEHNPVNTEKEIEGT